MRNLMRNVTKISYKLYLGEQDLLDDDGYRTGEKGISYSDFSECYMSISGNKSDSEMSQFGRNLDYDRTMSTADMKCDIDEHSLLWIDNDVNGPHNFIVKKRSVTPNQIQFAIKQVNVNEEDSV